jgi:hypothetical protein
VNLLASRVVLRPRSLADVLDLAIPFCLMNKRPLGLLAAIALAPIAALAAWLRIGKQWDWDDLWLVIAGAAFLFQGVFTVALGELLFQEPRNVRVRAHLRRFLHRLPACFISMLARTVVLIASAILIVMPFFLAPPSAFITEALLLENATPGKALARSRALSRNRLFSCLGLWLAALALPAFGAVAMDVMGNAVVGIVLQLGSPTGELFEQGGSGFAVLGFLLCIPIAAAMRFLYYIDLRTRKEGWDIQLRFVSLAEQAAAGRRFAA